MDGFEILTWIAAFLFVILGIGLPEGDGLAPPAESGLDGKGHLAGDEDVLDRSIDPFGG